MAETIVRVTDRTYQAIVSGAMFESWPGGDAPPEGTRVVVFDRDLEFTQHKVAAVCDASVRIGPAIPWGSQ